jgi:thiamine-phosphate pyrophosphorylase
VPSSPPKRLYPIVDFATCRRHGISPGDLARLAIEVRPRWLQLRAKDTSSDAFLAVIESLVVPARDAAVELVVNDRPDLAELAGAPTVHVGQGDLTPEEVRRFSPRLRVGVSTHSLEQLARALEARPDYVAFGPVFRTTTKENPDPTVGLSGLRRAHAVCRAAGVPLVAIGGIDSRHRSEVAAHCEGVCVISSVFERGAEASAIEAQLLALSELCRR